MTSAIHVRAIAWFVFCAFATVLMATNTGAAQSIDGLLPEPFRSGDFDRKLHSLDLDWAQRIAIEREHEEYKAHYAAILEGELNRLTTSFAGLYAESPWASMGLSMDALLGARGSVPDRKELERVLRIRRTALGQVSKLDDELFDAIAFHLRADQVEALGHIERALQRKRSDVELMRGPLGSKFPDLVALLETLDLSEQDRHAIEGPLTEYEITSSRALETANEKAIGLLVRLFEEMEDLGLAPAQNFAPAQQAMSALDGAVREAAENAYIAAKGVRTLIDRSFDAIAAHLPAEKSEAFRIAYLKEAYPEVYQSDPESPRSMFAFLDEIRDRLLPDVLQSIHDLKISWAAAHDSFSRSMVAAVEDERQRSFEPPGKAETDSGADQRLEALRQQRSAMNARTADSILALLSDDELRSEVEQRRAAPNRLEFGSITLSFSAADISIEGADGGEFVLQMSDGNTLVLTARRIGPRVDPMMPGPMTSSEFGLYADRMSLNVDGRLLAEDLLADYRTEFQRLASEQVRPMITTAQQTAGAQCPVDVAQAVASARRRALALLMGVDQEFFDDLSLFLLREEEARLPDIQTARECIVYDVTNSSGNWLNQSGSVNLARSLASIGLESAEVRAIARLLAEYDRIRLPLLKEQYETTIRRDLAEAKAAQSEAEGDAANASERYQRIVQPIKDSLESLSERRREIDNEYASRIIDALPIDKGEKLALRIKGQAYPGIWPDRQNAERFIEQALALPTLTNEQRGRIEIIYADHVDEHESLSNEMMALEDEGSARANAGNLTSDDRAKMQRLEQQKAVLRYLREEWNTTTRRSVRAALTEEQASQLETLEPMPRTFRPQQIIPARITIEGG